ncbi:MAG: amidohydrolase family protein [Acidimicrobiales bacterium]
MSEAAHIQVIDVDTHVTEPRDLWSSRLPNKYLERAPRVEVDVESGLKRWIVGDFALSPEAQSCHAGWREFHPSFPPTLEEADPAGWDAHARLKRMDEHGIFAQMLYPNLLGFQFYAFMDMGDIDLSLACVRAYNDFQTDFCSADPRRLIPIANLPIWDVPASVRELERCAAAGHRGINFGVEMERLGFPPLKSGHWDPLLAAAQDLNLPVTFHIGFQVGTKKTSLERRALAMADPVEGAKHTALLFAGNMNGIAEVIMGGICARFPRLKFVSVESGYGYVPFLLEALDWQFRNSAARSIRSDWLLPSEFFRRQMYATFWFEQGIHRQIDLYPDNVMFESDFPHPTSLSPGPGSIAQSAKDTIIANLAALDDATLRKVLHETAASVYGL